MDVSASHRPIHHTGENAEVRVVSATDWALLILRVALGIVFVAHGCQKVFGLFGGDGLAGTAAKMHAGMGVPAPLAYVASFTELLGGLGVLLGVLARLGGVGIAIVMVVAMTQVHMKNGFFLPGGFEYTFALLGMALALVVAGPGKIAVGDFEARLFQRGDSSSQRVEE